MSCVVFPGVRFLQGLQNVMDATLPADKGPSSPREAVDGLVLRWPAPGSDAEVLSRWFEEALKQVDTLSQDKQWIFSANCLGQLLSADVLLKLLSDLEGYGFETQKDAVRLFAGLLKLLERGGAEAAVASYVRSRPQVVHALIAGCAKPEVSCHFGEILRACTRYPQLVTALLDGGLATELLELAGASGVPDVSLEAFGSLRELLLAQRPAAASFLQTHFQEFFDRYHALLRSEDYLTQRQSLRLLSDLLVDRAYSKVMLQYIRYDRYLQLHMNLLRNDSKAIRIEAFHVFKLFAFNPQKPPKVQRILLRNRERLVQLLTDQAQKAEEDLSHDVQDVVKALMSDGPRTAEAVNPK